MPVAAYPFPTQYVNALQRAHYEVYRADINGDGAADFLLKAQRKIAIVDFDVPIPIPLKPPSPTFLLRSNGGTYVLEVDPPSGTVGNPLWQRSSDELVYGDVQGIGTNAMLIRARVIGSPSFVVSTRESDGQPALVQHMTPAQLGIDIGDAAVTVALTDVNRDGRADLVIRTSGTITAVLLASSDGLFAKPADDQQSSVAAWHAFSAALNAGDLPSALNFIAVDSVPKYSAALTALGAGVASLTQNWSAPVPMSVQPDFAVYMIRENYEGVQRSYLVTIVLENGRWVIDEL